MASEKLAIGLDIGSTSIKLVGLKKQRNRYVLEYFGIKHIPPESIVDGALMNSSVVIKSIQELVKELRVPRKEVAIGINGNSVIIKKLTMPMMSHFELDETIAAEMQQYIPFDAKDVFVDTFILPEGKDEDSAQMDVVLVAAKKEIVNDYMSVVGESGLKPVVVDVDVFAIQNCFHANYGINEKETVALINIGAEVININIIQKGVSQFTRDVHIGGQQFSEEIQKQFNVSFDEAEILKSASHEAQLAPETQKQIQSSLEKIAEQVAGEIQRSLDFYSGTNGDSHLAKVYVSGGAAKTPRLIQAIQNRTRTQTEALHPFKEIHVDSKRFSSHFMEEMGTLGAVAVGLALRRAGDKLY
ncbi:MAG: pilus assembly protein PilM [Cystobacterineae bacterium]|nr:pilus assembly protein PilM [Cystobacterineae bacterium]